MAYDNTNTGALFINENRTTDKQPNAKGSINIEGKEYWLSAWTRVSQKGQRYQQLAVTPKDQQRPADDINSNPTTISFDDDIPF